MVHECVRCGQQKNAHPVAAYESQTGDTSYCLTYSPPAPVWMQALTRLLDRR